MDMYIEKEMHNGIYMLPKCSTCQKAKKWLDENKIVYTERHIVEANPSAEELKMWYKRSGLPLKSSLTRAVGSIRK